MKIRAILFCALLLVSALASVFAADPYFSAAFDSGREGLRPQGFTFDTSDDAYWSIQNGWLDTGSGGDIITADGYSFAVAETPGAEAWRDYSISASFYMAQARGQVILAGRWIDRANHYQAVVEVFEGRRFLKIIKMFRGRPTELKVEPISLDSLGVSTIENGSPATALSLTLTFAGSQITAALGGQMRISAQDLDISSGKAALGERYTRALFRSITVAPPESAGAPATQPSGAQGKTYTVQLNTYRNIADARNMAAQLRLQGYYPAITQQGNSFNVTLGQFADRQEADKMLLQMLSEQFLFAKVVEVQTSSQTAQATPPPAAQSRTDQALLAAVPAELRKSMNWRDLSPADQRKVLEAIRAEEALRSRNQSVGEIMELKQRIESLNEKQAQMLNTLQQTEQQDKKRVLDINQLITQINRAIDGQDMARATQLVNDLEKLDPINPLVVLKRKEIEHRKNNTWEGYDQQKEMLKKEIASLQTEAAAKEASNRLKEAQQLWITIYSKDPLNAEASKIKQEIDRLGQRVLLEDEAVEKARTQKFTKMMYLAMAAAAALVVLAVIFLIWMVRRRHAQIMLQMEQRAIAPLLELREKTLVLSASGAGAANIAFDSPNLLSSPETHDAEFVIPDMDTKPRARAASPAADTVEISSDDFAPSFEETNPPAPAAPKARPEPKPAPKPAVQAPASGADDDFVMDFGEEEEQKRDKRVSTLPRSPSSPTPVEGGDDQIVFSFDDMQALAKSQQSASTDAPVTATEIPSIAAGTADEDIVFNFDDAISQTSTQKPVAPKPKAPTATSDDSIFESISLDDLSLDIPTAQTAGASTIQSKTATGGSTEILNPLTEDLNLDLDLKIDMPADATSGGITATTPPAEGTKDASIPGFDFSDILASETTPLGGSGTGTGNGVLYQQNYDKESVGSTPGAWSGEKSDYAALSIADDPDGGGGKCLVFNKTRGDGPTSFACRFPDVSGRVAVEFDLRCDSKNKHLLGFYIEKDSDFRRSVHTVIQSIDPDRPAYLRVFTKPTPYTLGSWRHIKYIIDMPNGIVDGYVDGKLVAEGVRMGTKAESLNTFSIRDNTESTGVLMLNNLVIYKAPAA